MGGEAEAGGSRVGAGKAITSLYLYFLLTQNHQNRNRDGQRKGLKSCSIHMFSGLSQGALEAECLLE